MLLPSAPAAHTSPLRHLPAVRGSMPPAPCIMCHWPALTLMSLCVCECVCFCILSGRKMSLISSKTELNYLSELNKCFWLCKVFHYKAITTVFLVTEVSVRDRLRKFTSIPHRTHVYMDVITCTITNCVNSLCALLFLRVIRNKRV